MLLLLFPVLAGAGEGAAAGAGDAAMAGPDPRVYLDLTFAGDLMAHKPNWEMDDFGRIHVRLASFLRQDDLSFINLETPVDNAAPWATYPAFNVHSPYVQAAIDAGFDVFSLANNHSYDRYSKGTRATVEAMDELAGAAKSRGRLVVHSGLRVPGSTPDTAMEVRAIELKGLRIGFLAIAEYMNFARHDGMTYHVNYLDPKIRDSFLEWLRVEAPKWDLFVLSLHTGVEYERAPTSAFRDFAALMVEAGVDLVWGHHPHVLQPWYVLPGPDGADRLVMASMGNYVSGQTWHLGPGDAGKDRAWTGDSALMRVRIAVDMTAPVKAPVLVSARPLMIGHLRLQGGGVGAWPYELLLVSVPEKWKAYYAARLDKLRAWYPGAPEPPPAWRAWNPRKPAP